MTAPSHASDRRPARRTSTCGRIRSAVASTSRFAGQGLRGLIAAAVLLALVVGLPWALWHYGWPLPNGVPTWTDIQGVLLGPMTTTFLLNFVACLCWITWTTFTFDVLRCTLDLARRGFDAARLPGLSPAGPMHALAGVLVGAALLSVLGNRSAPAPGSSSSSTPDIGTQVVASAPAWQDPMPDNEILVRKAVFANPDSVGDTATVNTPTHPVSVVVLAPHKGVYDSLWRIAERTLSDGARWPEIFEANKGKPQPNGHPFTKPSLIFPGQELALPANASAAPQSAEPHHTEVPTLPEPTSPGSTTVPPSRTSPPTTAQPPTSSPQSSPATPAPSTQQAPTATGSASGLTVRREPSLRLGSELFVGLGLAAAVSAALMVARRRHCARYRPGSGDREDLAVAPVVYQLRLAHLRAEADDEIDLDDGEEVGERPRRIPPLPAVVVGAPMAGLSERRTTLAAGFGVRDGREIALDLAVARGLGLVGAGAAAAVRALLLAALTTTDRSANPASSAGMSVVLVPADDLPAVLGHRASCVPTSLRVVADLDAALDVLEAETLVRAASGDQDAQPLVLAARTPQQHQRLQAVLDNGAPFGITGLLLGQWQPGITCYVRDDGTISATDPGLGVALRGTRMFRVGGGDTADLLALLRQVEPPADDPHGDNGDSGDDVAVESVADTKPEVTAAVETAPRTEIELEILGPSRPLPPGARLRPRAAPRLAPLDTPSPGEAAGGSAPTDEQAPFVAAEPAPAAATENASNNTRGGTEDRVADEQRALITITVLGGLRVHWHPDAGDDAGLGQEITGVLQPRSQVLLVLLALHPDGTTRDTLVEALWGEDPPARPTNSLHTALARLRRDLSRATNGAAGEVAAVDNGRYRLDPARVRVDYWRFATAVAARRTATTDSERVAAYREIVDSYGGHVADGLSKIDWIEPAREAIRRDAIDAVSGLARAMVTDDPQQTLDLLEVARAFDPHNELLYRDIMRLQERLGQHDAIPRTLTLLTTRLAEVNDKPTPQARGLAARLGQRHDTDRTEHADCSVGPGPGAVRGERGRSA